MIFCLGDFDGKMVWYGTAQRQLESCGQTTRAVWDLYPRVRVRVQAHTHATSYLLRVISTNDKNTSLPSSILHVSLLAYTYIHTLSSPNRVPYYLSTLHTSCRIHRINWLTSLSFDRSSRVAVFLK